MKIRNLETSTDLIQEQAAELLFKGFADTSPESWPTMREAREEVEDALGPGRIAVVAIEDDRVIGWAGAIRQYNGNTWELHPLVVDSAHRNSGLGTALVIEIESRINDSGGLTIWVATDDESGQTSLWGQNLYPNPLKGLTQLKNLKGHPYEFYEKLGFAICGVLPDANGLGKPDIFLAKRVRSIK